MAECKDVPNPNERSTKSARSRLRQPQFAMLRNHDLPALSGNPVQYAQNFVDRGVGIAAHAPVIDNYEELATVLVAAQHVRDIHEVPSPAIVGAHDVQLAIMPLVSGIGIKFQIHVRIFWEAELFDGAVPVLDPDEKLFDMISCRINAKVPVVDIELKDSVVQKRPYLWSDVYAPAAGPVFRGD